MRINALTRKIGTAILGLSMMFGLGVAMSTTAKAQDPWWRTQQDRRDRDREYRRDRDRDWDYRNRDWDYRNNRRRGRYNDDYPNWGGTFQLRQTALNAGYNEGIKEGRRDRNRYGNRSPYEFSAYQRATKDYDSRYGDRELYRQYFRQAFVRGYDAGLQGY